VGKKGWAELGDGVAASVVAGEGAINPYEQSCGRMWGLSPPCLQRASGGKRNMPLGPRMASYSPVGGKGRLVPMTWVSLSTAEMVKAPGRMPAHIWASMPSCGGREGINGTGVSSCPEAHRMWASFLYYSFVDKVII
jgi:hypothetical protein